MSLKRQLIYIDEKDETSRIVSYSHRGNKYAIVFKNNDKEYIYNSNRIKVVRTAISEDKAYNIFNYLREIADTTKNLPLGIIVYTKRLQI